MPVENTISHQTKKNKTKAYIALAIVCFFWGTTWIASKQGVKYMPALQMAGLRQLMGGTAYLVYFMSKGRVLPKGREWRTVVMLSILSFMGSNGLSTWGVKYISAGLGSIIGAIFPLWLVIIGYTRAQKLSTQSILGIIMGFGGICVIFYEHMADFLNPEFSFGIFVSLVGTLCWALGTTFTKERATQFNPYFSLGLQMMISGTALLIITTATGNTIPVSQIPWQSWTAMSYLVAFGSVFSFVAYLYALQHLPIEQASIYAYINPIVAILFGVWLFDEKFSVSIAIGGLIALAGVYLVNRENFRKSGLKSSVSDQRELASE